MRKSALVAWLALALVGTACSSEQPRRPLVVSAAASLADAFAEIETAFELAHPEVDVVLNTGGSAALREQILGGAPAAVFASADEANMEPIVTEGLVDGEPTTFATNRMMIAVPEQNPAGVVGLADLSREGLLVGLCAPAVPCGRFAAEVLARADVAPSVDTEESDVRSLLTKIEAGELDAGIVYATDIAAARVDAVAIPDAVNVTARYPIAAMKGSMVEDARRFVAFVTSPDGQSILARFGFGTP